MVRASESADGRAQKPCDPSLPPEHARRGPALARPPVVGLPPAAAQPAPAPSARLAFARQRGACSSEASPQRHKEHKEEADQQSTRTAQTQERDRLRLSSLCPLCLCGYWSYAAAEHNSAGKASASRSISSSVL